MCIVLKGKHIKASQGWRSPLKRTCNSRTPHNTMPPPPPPPQKKKPRLWPSVSEQKDKYRICNPKAWRKINFYRKLQEEYIVEYPHQWKCKYCLTYNKVLWCQNLDLLEISYMYVYVYMCIRYICLFVNIIRNRRTVSVQALSIYNLQNKGA